MNYPSDLTDAQWEAIRPWLEYINGYGNRRQHPLRLMIKAILYLVKTGCPGRQLPHDFPNWKSDYSGYARLCKRGTWEKVLDGINRKHRVQQGRNPDPSCVIIDSPSVKTVSGGDQRGFDGGKKGEGVKTAHRRGHGRTLAPCGSDGGERGGHDDGRLWRNFTSPKSINSLQSNNLYAFWGLICSHYYFCLYPLQDI